MKLCEHGDEQLKSKKFGDFLEQLSNYQLSKRTCTPLSQLDSYLASQLTGFIRNTVIGVILRTILKRYSDNNQTRPSWGEVENEWLYTSTDPIRVHRVDRDNFSVVPKQSVDTKLQHSTGYVRPPRMTPFVSSRYHVTRPAHAHCPSALSNEHPVYRKCCYVRYAAMWCFVSLN